MVSTAAATALRVVPSWLAAPAWTQCCHRGSTASSSVGIAAVAARAASCAVETENGRQSGRGPCARTVGVRRCRGRPGRVAGSRRGVWRYRAFLIVSDRSDRIFGFGLGIELFVVVEEIQRPLKATLPDLCGPGLVDIGCDLVYGEANVARFDECVQDVLLDRVVVVVWASVVKMHRRRSGACESDAEKSPPCGRDHPPVTPTRRRCRVTSSRRGVLCKAMVSSLAGWQPSCPGGHVLITDNFSAFRRWELSRPRGRHPSESLKNHTRRTCRLTRRGRGREPGSKRSDDTRIGRSRGLAVQGLRRRGRLNVTVLVRKHPAVAGGAVLW